MTARGDIAMDHDNPYAPPIKAQVASVKSPRGPLSPSSELFMIHVPCWVGGTAIGALSRWLRESFTRGIHYEAIGETAAKTGIVLALLSVCWMGGVKRPRLSYSLSTTSLWIGAAVGWSLVHGGIWLDYLRVNAFLCTICLAVGVVLLSLRSRRYIRVPDALEGD